MRGCKKVESGRFHVKLHAIQEVIFLEYEMCTRSNVGSRLVNDVLPSIVGRSLFAETQSDVCSHASGVPRL